MRSVGVLTVLYQKHACLQVREFEVDTYALLYLKWKTKNDLLTQYRELCSMLCNNLNGKIIWKIIDTCISISLSGVQLFVTPWTVACQAVLSMGFPRPGYWSGLPFPSPGETPEPRIKSASPALAGNSLTLSHQGSPFISFNSVAQSCPTLCDPMNCSTPGLAVHHQLPEFTQTHMHRVSDAIQSSHPLLSPFPPAPNPSQYESLFQWVNSSHEVAKVLEFQL